MVTSRIAWTPSVRLIAARLPRLNIFESVARPDDLPAVLQIEALTNPRLHAAVGPIAAIPVADRVVGPGASFAMAPFAYPSNARFSDALHGAYYAAGDLATAIAEVSFHRARFAARTPTPPMDFDERIVEAEIDADLRDLRGEPPDAFLFDPDPERYAATQAFARAESANGAQGVIYRSVRRSAGACVALFVPRLVRNPRTAGYVGLRWDGTRISDAYRKESLGNVYPG